MGLNFDCLVDHVDEVTSHQMTLYHIEICGIAFLIITIILPFTMLMALSYRRNIKLL
jgi:hypothetical protein